MTKISSELLLFSKLLIMYMEKSLEDVEGGDDYAFGNYQDGYRDACLKLEEYIEALIKDMGSGSI